MQRLWTSDEDAVIRTRYVSDGAAAVAVTLGRSFASTTKRARRLDVIRRRRWTPADDARLCKAWGAGTLDAVAQALGRTTATTYWRAQRLGLELGCPQGMEYLTAAAERTGYATAQLRRVLAWSRVPLVCAWARPGCDRGRSTHIVDAFDVDRAVEAWLTTETIHGAARARGLCGETLHAWLVEAGEVPARASTPRTRRHHGIASASIDRVIAARLATESVSQGAVRHGLTRQTLTQWLHLSGVRRGASKVWRLDVAVIDRVVAERRPRSRARLAS